MSEVLIYDAVRTPTGHYGGGLSGIRPDDLAAGVVRSLLDRNPGVDPSAVQNVVLGNANGAGEENRNVGRMAALLAGLPTSVPGVTVNRLCGSALEATIIASREIQVGDSELVVAGGVESMTRAPLVMAKPDRGFPRGDMTMYSTTLGWRLINPNMPKQWLISLGMSTELLVERFAITREAQDEFAYRSHQRAHMAWERGFFENEVVPVEGAELVRDESIRPDTSIEKLATLRPAFKPDGTVTGGNASPLNDGASALLLGSETAALRFGLTPMARIVSRGTSAVDPDVFGLGPVAAANQALQRAGLTWDQIGLVELNEAFAAQSLACLQHWPDLDPDKVNISGGAIALGHALGSSGTRILTTLVHNLRRTGARYGLATLCIGVGQGVAIVVESMAA